MAHARIRIPERSAGRAAPWNSLLCSFAPGRKTLLVCATGRRSLAATQELRDRGLSEVYSLRGGVKGIRTRLLT